MEGAIVQLLGMQLLRGATEALSREALQVCAKPSRVSRSFRLEPGLEEHTLQTLPLPRM